MKSGKILYAATVVKTHIRQFHVPYLRMLQENGWHTEVAARNDYENPEDCIIPGCDEYHDIPFERMPWKPANIQAYRQLKALIQEKKYDVIHCHTPVGAMITRLAARSARKQGTKVVYTAHGFHFFRGAPLRNWLLYYPAEWLLAPLTDVLVTINREDDAFARKHLRAKQILYIPGVGVNREKFCPNPERRAEKRRELGLSDDCFAILTVAEMTKNKNHETVLKALALLKDQKEYASIRYLICGRGEEQPRLEALSRKLGIFDHVEFLGYRSDADDLYRAADLFAFMSHREGLSLALMEAMSSGLPVVCTRIRGNTDLVENNVSGVFSANSPDVLAGAILRLCWDPALRQHIGAAAREKTADFDSHLVMDRMMALYRQL